MSTPSEALTELVSLYAATVADHDAHYTREVFESHPDWHGAWNKKRSGVSRLARELVSMLAEAGAVDRASAVVVDGFAYWAERYELKREQA